MKHQILVNSLDAERMRSGELSNGLFVCQCQGFFSRQDLLRGRFSNVVLRFDDVIFDNLDDSFFYNSSWRQVWMQHLHHKQKRCKRVEYHTMFLYKITNGCLSYHIFRMVSKRIIKGPTIGVVQQTIVSLAGEIMKDQQTAYNSRYMFSIRTSY